MGAEEWARISAGPDNLANLAEDLLTMGNKLALYNRLVRRWKFSRGPDGVAFKLATLDELETGHMKYSRRAMARMLPHLRDGKNEHDAREAAGYGEPKSAVPPGDPAKELLPLKAVPETANPRVQRAMFAVRRIVNAAARKWGAPAAIRVEMPRDMKAAKKHRREIEKEQAANRKRNAEAEALMREKGWPGRIHREDLQKFKMWHFEQGCHCPYCGHSISWEDLASEAAEADHIIPQSAFRQGHMNLVVAHKKCNQDKGGRTPWQAWGENDLDRWDHIANLADLKKPGMAKLPEEKRRRILNKNPNPVDDEGFCRRALQDTQYISKLVHGFLKATGIPVQVSRGQATSILRRDWGLEGKGMLPRPPADEAKERPGKNRLDHRHHAVDAFVVALTDLSLLQRLIKHCQQMEQFRYQRGARPDPFPPPDGWAGNITADVRGRLEGKIVSHQKNSKVRGALHKETIHGRGFFLDEAESAKAWQPNKPGRERVRKLLGPAESPRRPDSRGDISEDGDIKWIANARIFDGLAEWAEKSPGTPLPADLAAKLTEGDDKMRIPVVRRFYFHRRGLPDALKYADGEWRPGSGGQWIVDKGVHETLRKWMAKHALKSDNRTGIERAMKADPPQTSAREGRRGNPIRTVRMGMIKRGVKTLSPKARCNRPAPPPRSVELRHNHHLEIFRKGDERELRMVSMLEAAGRKSRKEPIVNREPDPAEWGAGWEFQCSLAIGDLVVFDREQVSGRIQNDLDEHRAMFQSTVYRVQKMSMTPGPDIYFRHHSVAVVDSDYGEIRVKSAADLALRKVEVGVLGADFAALER